MKNPDIKVNKGARNQKKSHECFKFYRSELIFTHDGVFVPFR